MFAHLRLLLSIFSFMAFTVDPKSGEENPPKDPGKNQDPPKEDDPPTNDDPPADRSKWTVEQWQDEMKRVAKKEKDEGRKAAAREYQEQQDEAKRKADLAKEEAEGNYESAKKKLESELESATGTRDKALELLKANVDARWNEMPESVRETYAGDEDDVLAKSAYMQQMKPIIDELAEKAKASKAGGNPPNPKAATGKVEVPSAVSRPRMW